MKKINIVDMTIRESVEKSDVTMSFKEKIEVAKQLDKLEIDVIEMPQIIDGKTDLLFMKSIAPILKNSTISATVGMSKEEIDMVSEAMSAASKKRIHISVPTSPIQMEFVCNKKPSKVLEQIEELVTYARTQCNEVEFSAHDATRSEDEFLIESVSRAIKAGAPIITFCDNAGVQLPEEMTAFI